MLRDRFTVLLRFAFGSGLLCGCDPFPSVGDAVPPGRHPTLALFPPASPPAPVASLRNGRGDETFFFVDRDPRTGRDRLAQALSRSRSGPTLRAHLGDQGEVVRVDNETSGELAVFAWSEHRVVVQLF